MITILQDEEQLAKTKSVKEAELKVQLALKAILRDDAIQRLSLMRMSNESLYRQVVSYLFSLYNSGRITSKISEEQLKHIASTFLQNKPESKITRVSK